MHCEGFGTTHAVLGGRLNKEMKMKELFNNNMLFCVKIIIENKYYIKYMYQHRNMIINLGEHIF